mmetsp:Transcript_74067/g.211460  ORF Transcript_74067/g.211460 Transcript_74067/m.211460 type:complete len:205 (-) Transcript_74067:93-707(-)
MAIKPNAVAARCLGVLETDTDKAWDWYRTAWSIAVAEEEDEVGTRERLLLGLSTEMAFLGQTLAQGTGNQGSSYDDDYTKLSELLTLIDDLGDHCESCRRTDAVLTSKAKVALYAHSDATAALAIVSAPGELGCFPTYASDRPDLSMIWNDAQELIAAQEKGSTLTLLEAKKVREAHKVPASIGCQYATSWCTNTEKYGATAPF